MTSIAIEDRGEPGLVSRAKHLVKRAVRLTGYDISRIDPDRSLDEFLRMLFAHYDINCVLDVGANQGQYARGLRAIGYRGYIVSFEALAEPFERLRRRCERDPRWSAHRLALGSREESAPMNVNARSEWSSFHEPLLTSMPDHSADQRGVRDTEVVTVRRLDDVFEQCTRHVADPRVYLKVDTQGWDLEVLRGAERTLDDVLALQTEVSLKPVYVDAPTYHDSIEHIRAAGFDVAAMFPVGRYRYLAAIEFDCVAARVQ